MQHIEGFSRKRVPFKIHPQNLQTRSFAKWAQIRCMFCEKQIYTFEKGIDFSQLHFLKNRSDFLIAFLEKL
jgi:hypothetical protein